MFYSQIPNTLNRQARILVSHGKKKFKAFMYSSIYWFVDLSDIHANRFVSFSIATLKSVWIFPSQTFFMTESPGRTMYHVQAELIFSWYAAYISDPAGKVLKYFPFS